MEVTKFLGGYSRGKYGVRIDWDEGIVDEFCAIGPAIPAKVFHYRASIFFVSPATVPERLRAEVIECMPIIEELAALYKGTVWDGHNLVGDWIDQPEEMEELAYRLQSAFESVVQYWDADDWLGVADLVEVSRLGSTIDDIATALKSEARDGGVWINHSDTVQVLEDRLGELLLEMIEQSQDPDSGYTAAHHDDMRHIQTLLAGEE